MTYKRYCQQIIIDGLNKIDPETTVNGYDLGLLIKDNMIMPRRVDNQTMSVWATEMDEYYRYAIEEFGTVCNPFNDRDAFFKECTGYNVCLMLSLSNTVRDLVDDPFKVSDYRAQIIADLMNVKELILQEVF
ncbi:hypothetical protein [Exiguobacterium sp. s133]|uniref:hypothetical protein n=1 Tax=Exiguobacterium sp. s133 TaxID=2751213 RepID=UPI001BEBFDE4|nr:hypothetical protein [Exiguobacterium sp. s133]